MPVDRDPVQIARALADRFEQAEIPYAVGGALALAYWAPPRGTADADLNVFVSADQVAAVDAALRAIEEEGVTLDRAVALHEIAAGGAVRGMAGRTPVDVFFDSIPFHRSAAGRVVERPLVGRPAKVLAAEDLIVLKFLFNRGKDLVDIEGMVATCGASLDRGYVRRWLVDCVGEADVRVRDWDALVAPLGP